VKSDVSKSNSAIAPRIRNAFVRELMGHLMLLVPALLILCAGLFLARVIEARFESHRSAVVSPLTDADAAVQLSRCPVLRGERVLDIKKIKTYATDQRRVDYEYRDGKTSAVSSGTAQFSWKEGAWRAVVCR
jgi:hypothetical protein